jgi:hypothetical protein
MKKWSGTISLDYHLFRTNAIEGKDKRVALYTTCQSLQKFVLNGQTYYKEETEIIWQCTRYGKSHDKLKYVQDLYVNDFEF